MFSKMFEIFYFLVAARIQKEQITRCLQQSIPTQQKKHSSMLPDMRRMEKEA